MGTSERIKYSFEIIKKEPHCDAETVHTSANPCACDLSKKIKQELHCKEEVDIGWDDQDNIYGASNGEEHTQVVNNSHNPEESQYEKLPVGQNNEGKDGFSCRKCDFRCQTRRDLKDHIRLVHFRRAFVCARCGTKLKNNLSFKRHTRYCGKEPNEKCSYCPFKTKYRTYLSIHMTSVHSVQSPIECPNKCGSKLKNKESLKGHLTYCGMEHSNLQCDYCSHKFKRKGLLKRHLSRVHCDLDNMANKCPKCIKKFAAFSFLKKHVKFCGIKPIFQCDNCAYKSHRKFLLRNHILRIHLNIPNTEKKSIPPLRCPKCSKSFKSYTGFSKHTSGCGDFRCHYCTYRTKYAGHYKKHILKNHTNVPDEQDKIISLLRCSKCNRGFKTHTGLSKHLARCGEEVYFQCYYCPHRNKFKHNLRDHILRNHLGSSETDMNSMISLHESVAS